MIMPVYLVEANMYNLVYKITNIVLRYSLLRGQVCAISTLATTAAEEVQVQHLIFTCGETLTGIFSPSAFFPIVKTE